MRALPMVVRVAGLPAPWLEPLEIIRRQGPRLNEAWFRFVGRPEIPIPRFEHMACVAMPGQSIEVGLIFNISPASRQQSCWPLFLGTICQGKATLMIGVSEAQVDQVMDIIRDNTHPRARRGWWARPGKHQEGAATTFVMDMEQAELPE